MHHILDVSLAWLQTQYFFLPRALMSHLDLQSRLYQMAFYQNVH